MTRDQRDALRGDRPKKSRKRDEFKEAALVLMGAITALALVPSSRIKGIDGYLFGKLADEAARVQKLGGKR